MAGGRRSQRGGASVEHAALVLLAGALAIVAVAGARLLAEEGERPPLASELMRKQRCAVRFPDPCWQDPLTEAYGRRVAGAVRALTPAPVPRRAADGSAVVGVDPRRCRRTSCAALVPGQQRLTTANRRTTTFTAIRELGRERGVEIDYWIYRPTLGWELVRERAGPDRIEALAGTALLESADPALVPLETMLGRDEMRFAVGEQPPWRHRIESRWGR
jgi:hypothetical protein